jgi:hypothetical protein
MATHPTPDVLTLGAPEQPATMAGLMFRLAAALDILPQPIAIRISRFPDRYVQVSSIEDYEAWRQWLGAPETPPGEWKPYETSYAPTQQKREWSTVATLCGQPLTLVRVEMVPAAEEVPA